jgi:hypothetical protein
MNLGVKGLTGGLYLFIEINGHKKNYGRPALHSCRAGCAKRLLKTFGIEKHRERVANTGTSDLNGTTGHSHQTLIQAKSSVREVRALGRDDKGGMRERRTPPRGATISCCTRRGLPPTPW